MVKYKASQRKVDLYDIGNGLTLMNVLIKNEEGKLDFINTYIGTDKGDFCYVGCTKNLSEPGVTFSYTQYVRSMEANLQYYLDAFFTNVNNGN